MGGYPGEDCEMEVREKVIDGRFLDLIYSDIVQKSQSNMPCKDVSACKGCDLLLIGSACHGETPSPRAAGSKLPRFRRK